MGVVPFEGLNGRSVIGSGGEYRTGSDPNFGPSEIQNNDISANRGSKDGIFVSPQRPIARTASVSPSFAGSSINSRPPSCRFPLGKLLGLSLLLRSLSLSLSLSAFAVSGMLFLCLGCFPIADYFVRDLGVSFWFIGVVFGLLGFGVVDSELSALNYCVHCSHVSEAQCPGGGP